MEQQRGGPAFHGAAPGALAVTPRHHEADVGARMRVARNGLEGAVEPLGEAEPSDIALQNRRAVESPGPGISAHARRGGRGVSHDLWYYERKGSVLKWYFRRHGAVGGRAAGRHRSGQRAAERVPGWCYLARPE